MISGGRIPDTPGEELLSLREGRDEYFARTGIPADGGYEDAWVHLKLGPLPIAFPNTAERRRSVRIHDLHHVITGYNTNWLGEGLISAFEIGGGCADHVAAWFLNFGGLIFGLVLDPRATLEAFVRGRRSKNLYRTVFSDEMLAEQVGDARARLGIDADPSPARPAEFAAFAAWVAFVLVLVLTPLAVVVWGALVVVA